MLIWGAVSVSDFIISLILKLLLLLRAATCSLHIWRSLAMSLMPSQVFPISFISFSTVRRHVILGRPRLRFPSGVQCIAVFAMEASWRVTWPIHLQRLLIRMVAIDSVPHRSKRSLLEMTLGQKMRKIRRRLLVWKVESFDRSFSVKRQHSEPYRRVVRTQLQP